MAVKSILLILTVLTRFHANYPWPQDCYSDPNKMYFNLECIVSNRRIEMHADDQKLYITHKTVPTVIDFGTFPKLKINQELRSIKMENCTIKESLSFGALFEHFGIKDGILAFEGVNIGSSLDNRFSNGFEKVENLTLSRNKIKQLNENVFQTLTKLSTLDLSFNEISMLPKNVFENLSELRTLKLTMNKLTSLSDATFEHQKKLTHLHLDFNKLQRLARETFQGLDSLSVLKLLKNRLPELPDDVFYNIPRLSEVSLGNAGMNLSDKIFTRNYYLKYVYLQQVEATNGIQLSGLEKLQIRSSKLKTMYGLSNITNISITNSGLDSLTFSSFKDLRGLRRLNLSSNNLTDLSDGLFDGLDKLVHLQLSNNCLTIISGLIFRDLQNLIDVDLSNNRLTSIHPNAFVNTKQLEAINLGNNQLSFTDNRFPFLHLTKLKVLILHNNTLTKIPSGLKKMTELKEVDLRFNQISSLKFGELRDSNINFSSTYEVRADSESGAYYTYLDVNPLNCDCGMYDFLLGANQEQVADVFSHKCRKDDYHLKPCNRGNFSNGNCPDECVCTERESKLGLQVLVSCEGNGLTKIPEILIETVTSIELYVSNNSLTELMNLQDNLLVTFIQASYNKIFKIELKNLPPKLRGLDVSHNNIHTIGANVLRHVQNHQSLEIFFLKENPLECHCSSEDTKMLIEFSKENHSMTDLQGVKCNVNHELSIEILERDCLKNAIIEGLIIIAILLFLSGTSVFLFFKYQEFIKMWLHAHNFCSWWVNEENLDKDKIFDAFISYSQLDETYVHHLVNVLENGSPSYRCCVHERDFLAGQEIEKSILESVDTSRRTVIILSKSFLQSVWATHEFHCAYRRSIAENRKRLIIVKHGDIGDVSDTTIQSYIKTHTYIESDDRWFWEKIRYALPHKNLR